MVESPKLIATHQKPFQGCSPFQIQLWQIVGATFAAIVALLYYIVPLVTFFLIPAWLLLSRGSANSLIAATIALLLALTPIYISERLRTSRLFASISLYFKTSIWAEEDFCVYENHPKPVIHLFFPHGTISFGSWCFASLRILRPCRTACASVLLLMPILKHIMGVFDLVDGSRSKVKPLLLNWQVHRQDLALYPGGVAELFLTSPSQERVYFAHRKGCIKLALETGSDITVTYIFGNSLMYRILFSNYCAKISRILKASITIFWGRFGSLFPYRVPLVIVVSKIIQLPDYSKRPNELTMEVVESQHSRVKEELLRLFETYKHMHGDYKDKKLMIC